MDVIILVVCTCLIISRLVRMLGYYDPEQASKRSNIIMDLLNQNTVVKDIKDINAVVVSPYERDLPQQILTVINDIKSQDTSFEIEKFLNGAKKAYTMCLNAIYSSDSEPLSYLLDDEIRRTIQERMKADKDSAFNKSTVIKEITNIEIVDAALYGDRGVISVKITSSIISQTKDLNGNIISGSDVPSLKSANVVFSRYLGQEKIWKITKMDQI